MSELVFVEMCKCFWKLPEIKILLEIVPETDIHYDNDLSFITACKNGHIPIVEFIIEKLQTLRYTEPIAPIAPIFNIITFQNALSETITHNKLDMFIYLETYINNYLTKLNDKINDKSILKYNIDWAAVIQNGYKNVNICIYDIMPLTTYLYEHAHISKFIKQINNNFNILSHILKIACERGYKDIIKWIISMTQNANIQNANIQNTINTDDTINTVNTNDTVNTVNTNDTDNIIYHINLSDNRYEYLRITFNNPYYDNIQELIFEHSLPINPNDIEYLFRWCCMSSYGSLNIVQKIYDIAINLGIDTNISKNNNQLFKYVCNANKVEIAKWIYSLGNLSLDIIRENNDELFINFNGQKHNQIAEWFCTLYDKYEIIEENNYSVNYIECIVNK